MSTTHLERCQSAREWAFNRLVGITPHFANMSALAVWAETTNQSSEPTGAPANPSEWLLRVLAESTEAIAPLIGRALTPPAEKWVGPILDQRYLAALTEGDEPYI